MLIADAYCRRDLLEESALNTWYRFLGGFDADIFTEVVERHIQENSRPPAISELYEACKRKLHFKNQIGR